MNTENRNHLRSLWHRTEEITAQFPSLMQMGSFVRVVCVAPLQKSFRYNDLARLSQGLNCRALSATCAPLPHLQPGPRDHFGRSVRPRIGRVSLRGLFAGTSCSGHLMQQRWLHPSAAGKRQVGRATSPTIPSQPPSFQSERLAALRLGRLAAYVRNGWKTDISHWSDAPGQNASGPIERRKPVAMD